MPKQAKKVGGKAGGKSASKAVKKVPKKAARKAAPTSRAKVAKKVTKKAAAKTAPKRKGKRFLIIYHAPIDAMAQTINTTPEDMEKGMALWNAWAKRAGSKIADLGAPLANGKRLHANGSSFPSSKEVTGYPLLDAEDWDDVMSLLEGHPHISGWDPGATIEIHETMFIPGM